MMNQELVNRVLALGEASKQDAIERAAVEVQKETPKEPKVGKPLKMFPDDAAAMPQELTRAAIFCLIPNSLKNSNGMVKDFKVASREGETLSYTGPCLSPKDETVYLAVLRWARGVPMGQRIHITKTQFLAECGLTDTGPNWDSVEERLKRLHQASAALYRGQSRIYFHFLSFGVDDNTGQCYVHLDEEGRKVFECLSYQPWRVRLNLKTDFSRRLLSYVCGHKQGAAHKISLDNLRAWFGYGGRIDKFASQMKASLAELEYMGVVRHGWSVKKTGGRYVAQWTSSKMSVLV